MSLEESVAVATRDASIARLELHGPALLAAARTLTRTEADAQDLVQATFEIALSRIDDLRDPRAMRAWLLAIETREAFRVTRRLRRFVALDGRVEEMAASGPNVTDIALRAALARLPLRTRAVIVLHHLAGLRVDETAAALGTSPNTVKTQLRDGLVRLRRELGDG